MKFIIGMLLILGTLDSTLAAKNADMYATTSSVAKYGMLNAKSKLEGTSIEGIKCGYFLTKGTAYKSWGASLTFFIEDSSGNKEILYRMLNGTRNLDPIETLNIQTADERKIDKKKNTYSLIYRQKSGMLSSLLPSQKNTLVIVRKLNKDPNYQSQKDLNILKVDFTVDELKKSQFSYTRSTSISCSFAKNTGRF